MKNYFNIPPLLFLFLVFFSQIVRADHVALEKTFHDSGPYWKESNFDLAFEAPSLPTDGLGDHPLTLLDLNLGAGAMINTPWLLRPGREEYGQVLGSYGEEKKIRGKYQGKKGILKYSVDGEAKLDQRKFDYAGKNTQPETSGPQFFIKLNSNSWKYGGNWSEMDQRSFLAGQELGKEQKILFQNNLTLEENRFRFTGFVNITDQKFEPLHGSNSKTILSKKRHIGISKVVEFPGEMKWKSVFEQKTYKRNFKKPGDQETFSRTSGKLFLSKHGVQNAYLDYKLFLSYHFVKNEFENSQQNSHLISSTGYLSSLKSSPLGIEANALFYEKEPRSDLLFGDGKIILGANKLQFEQGEKLSVGPWFKYANYKGHIHYFLENVNDAIFLAGSSDEQKLIAFNLDHIWVKGFQAKTEFDFDPMKLTIQYTYQLAKSNISFNDQMNGTVPGRHKNTVESGVIVDYGWLESGITYTYKSSFYENAGTEQDWGKVSQLGAHFLYRANKGALKLSGDNLLNSSVGSRNAPRLNRYVGPDVPVGTDNSLRFSVSMEFIL